MPKEHRWITKRIPSTPDQPPGECVKECADCGLEYPGSWPEIELSPCEPEPPCTHEWGPHYYGHECVTCKLFVPFGCEPWAPNEDESDKEDCDD